MPRVIYSIHALSLYLYRVSNPQIFIYTMLKINPCYFLKKSYSLFFSKITFVYYFAIYFLHFSSFV